jgi:hypothetical protein
LSTYGWSSDPRTDAELQKKYGDSVHQPCARNVRKYKIMTRNLAVVLKTWLPVAVLEDCIRVDGAAICSTCELPFREHPEVAPTFHVGCDKTILKT